MSEFIIGGACLNQIPMHWEHNLSNIKNAIDEAKKNNVDILCLPELSITGYGCEDMFLSTWLQEKALDLIPEIQSWCKDIFVVVGLPIRKNGNVFNSICVINDQEILGFYAKHHLAIDGVHYENRWFTSWPQDKTETFSFNSKEYTFGSFFINHENIKIGFEICEDAWRADRPACFLAQHDVDLILNPSASHFAFHKAEFRENLVVESSRKFNCVYLYTNLLGNEAGRMIYDGDILLAQKGKLIGKNRRLSFRDFNLQSQKVSFDNPDNSEINLNDRIYNPLHEFAQVGSLALFDYLRKSKSKGFVLSLSGGADSSSIAILVAEMIRNGLNELDLKKFQEKLGIDFNLDRTTDKETQKKSIAEKLLTTAYQGTKNSSIETMESARLLAESIGATFYNWEIDEQVEGYTRTIEKQIGRKLSWDLDDITLQNIQARARSPIIWMLANLNNALLLTTSNRSEGDVGYATMDGDTSGSISPIAAVSKRFILEWLKYAEIELGYDGLKGVNSLQPTAELRPISMHQTDEDDLMPYPILEKIERLGIAQRKSPVEIFKSLKEEALTSDEQLKKYIKKFFRLWSRNQWKRERIAPSFHLDDFNVDPRTWCRFPILSSGFEKELQELEKATY